MIELTLAGYCPSCGAAASFTTIGDQETLDGPPVALGNCSQCGSTVALAHVETAAGWMKGHADWEASVSTTVDGASVTVKARGEHLTDLMHAVRAMRAELVALREDVRSQKTS